MRFAKLLPLFATAAFAAASPENAASQLQGRDANEAKRAIADSAEKTKQAIQDYVNAFAAWSLPLMPQLSAWDRKDIEPTIHQVQQFVNDQVTSSFGPLRDRCLQ